MVRGSRHTKAARLRMSLALRNPSPETRTRMREGQRRRREREALDPEARRHRLLAERERIDAELAQLV
jgi:hypothetical protein